MSDQPISTGSTAVDGTSFEYLTAGEGPLALVVHGFPDTPRSWERTVAALAGAGFRAVAPWTRGYAPTGVPADGDYRVARLAADINGLHDALGGGSDAVLVGHDWGAIAAYPAAATEADRWRRVVTASVPPPAALMGAMLEPAQVQRSWYIWFFQMAGLPEMVVPTDDFAFIERLWADWSPGLAAEDSRSAIDAVRAALADPTNLAAAIGYYRAMFSPDGGLSPEVNPQPTLYVHGADDGCIGGGLVDGSVTAALPGEGSEMVVLEGAGHFLQLDRPDEFNRLVVDFLTG